jgi:hypothetical protein
MPRTPAIVATCLLLASCGSGGGGGGGSGSTTVTPPTGPVTPANGTWSVGAVGLPMHVLVGGSGPATAQTDIHRDTRLDPGEIFLLPKSPLTAGATYEVRIAAFAGGSGVFDTTWRFTTGSSSASGTVLARLNAFRTASGVAAVTSDAELATAATRHAGYQRIANTITHNEPDTANALFTANLFYDRISIAHGAAAGSMAWPQSATTVYEDISSVGGTSGVDLLWNTVYHRVPMMRNAVFIIGSGDSDAARAAFPAAGVPTGNGYLTIEFGEAGSSVVAGYWPPHLATGVPASFNTDTESPDPLSSGNGQQTPATPDIATVGPPIHVTVPTAAAFTGLTATLTLVP